MEQIRIGVIGGGASGMTAAIIAAGAGADVTLLEGGERVGKKILSTGNGKCNFGNKSLSPEDYNGAEREWLRECLGQFDERATEEFFGGLGLLWKEKNGYLYPYSEQAAAVLDVLRIGLARAGVRVVTACKVREVKWQTQSEKGLDHKGFLVISDAGNYHFDRVILACGSKAAPKTGSDGSGYLLARKLGHRIVPVVPALVQLRCRENFLKEVAGVRAEARLTVLQERENTRDRIRESGELQLTDYGISGIPVFQLSRKVNYILAAKKKSASPEVEVSIDFLPDRSEEQAEGLWQDRIACLDKSGLTVEEFFTGMLNKKLMYLFIKLAGLKRDERAVKTDMRKLQRVFELCRDFRVHVTGSNSFDQAQVCAGGVDTAQVGTDMQSKLVPGLYFAGELLDVDGRCGGYNLQWAWCSGYLAGRNATGEGGEHVSFVQNE